MEIFKVEGFILNTTDFGDANRVVTIYTKNFGKIEVNAYGCRRAKNFLSGVIQMFNKICAEIKKGSQVDSIHDADILEFYPNLTADIEKLTYASIFFEIVNKMILPKIADVRIYNLLENFLPVINKKNPQIAALIAIAQFMEFTGFQLNFKNCVRCGKIIEDFASLNLTEGGAICENCTHGAIIGFNYQKNLRLTFEKFLNFDWKSETQINFSKNQIYSAEKIFFQYVQNILGQELKSVKFLRQIQG